MSALYIHIPFCRSRCAYCAFYSTTRLDVRQQYVDALCREAGMRGGGSVSTVYLGGGTPSQLTPRQLAQIFEAIDIHFSVSDDAEVTIECNPDDVSSEFAELLPRLGVNRVSMGVQTFNDGLLKTIHRRHNAHQVTAAVERLRSSGITNISLDLMYALPGQTMEILDSDVSAALSLRPQHLSAYALTYEEATPLWQQLQRGTIEETDDETQRNMYYSIKDRLEVAGYEHYELSNFALPHCRSRHNSSYWNHSPYIGLGAAAHSFNGQDCRQWNVSDIDTYIAGMASGTPATGGEKLDDDTLYNEAVMTRLRTREGIDLSTLPPHYRKHCLKEAAQYLDTLLTIEGDTMRLTRNGLFVSDMVMSSLMIINEECF